MVCVRVSRCALVIEWPFTIFLHEIGLRFAMGTSYNKKVSVRVFVRVRVRIPCAYLWELQCRDKPVKARGICIGSGSHAGSVLDPVLGCLGCIPGALTWTLMSGLFMINVLLLT